MKTFWIHWFSVMRSVHYGFFFFINSGPWLIITAAEIDQLIKWLAGRLVNRQLLSNGFNIFLSSLQIFLFIIDDWVGFLQVLTCLLLSLSAFLCSFFSTNILHSTHFSSVYLTVIIISHFWYMLVFYKCFFRKLNLRK